MAQQSQQGQQSQQSHSYQSLYQNQPGAIHHHNVHPPANAEELASNIASMSISSGPNSTAYAYSSQIPPPSQGYQVPVQPQNIPRQQLQLQSSAGHYGPGQALQGQSAIHYPHPQYQQPSGGEQHRQNPSYHPQHGQILHYVNQNGLPSTGQVMQSQNPIVRRPVPSINAQLQYAGPTTTGPSPTFLSGQSSQPQVYPPPPYTPGAQNPSPGYGSPVGTIQNHPQRNATPHNHVQQQHNAQLSAAGVASSQVYFPPPPSAYPQNTAPHSIPAVGSHQPSYHQQPQTVHAPTPVYPMKDAAANPSPTASQNQVRQSNISQSPGIPSIPQQNQSVLYTQTPNPSIYQQPSPPPVNAYSQPHAPTSQPVYHHPYTPQPGQPPQYTGNHTPLQQFPPPPPPPPTGPNYGHSQLSGSPAYAPPPSAAIPAQARASKRNSLNAEKLGATLGKGFKATTNFLTSSRGKKVALGAGVLAAGFLGFEAAEALSGSEAFMGGGGIDTGGSTDINASLAQHAIAEQGQMNAMSLIDDTTYVRTDI